MDRHGAARRLAVIAAEDERLNARVGRRHRHPCGRPASTWPTACGSAIAYGLSAWGPALRITSRGFQRCIVAPRDLRPIHHVPPCSHVFSTTILILQVVGVLPHIETQDGHLDVH